jgi:hypothetical protein
MKVRTFGAVPWLVVVWLFVLAWAGAPAQAGPCCFQASDIDCDGVTDFNDVAPFGAQLGQGSPGPSGLPCAGTVPCP